MLKIQNEHGNEVAKLKQQIMEQELEKKKILCNRVFQRIVNRQLVCAWEEWRHHVKTQNLLHRISARFRSHGKSRTMNTWIAYVRHRKYSRDLANRVFKRLDNRGLSAAWTQWVAYLNFSKHTASIAKIQEQNESNIEAWRKETSTKHLFLKKMSSRRVSLVKVFTRWRVYTVKEKDLRLVQAMNVLRNALHNSHEELRIMREQYHVHLQFEVEGMLRYVNQAGKGQAKKRPVYQNAESILHTHENNLYHKTKGSTSRPDHKSIVRLEHTQNDDGDKQNVSLHKKLVAANNGKPIPWLSSTSLSKSANSTGRIQEKLAQSFSSTYHRRLNDDRPQPRKKKKSVAEIIYGKEAIGKSKGKNRGRNAGSGPRNMETSLRTNSGKPMGSKTRMKSWVQTKGKHRVSRSHPRISTPVDQEPLISHGKKFDKKRHFLNTLQKLRNTVESLYLDQESFGKNIIKHASATVLNSPPLTPETVHMPNDELEEKGKFPPESEDYEIELTAMKLLQLLQARGKGSGAMLQSGASGIEDQALTRTNDAAEEFDTMLVDYAKRVHNYKDPSLVEARRPMPPLNMNKKL